MYGFLQRLSMLVQTPLHGMSLFFASVVGFIVFLNAMDLFVMRQWDFSVYYMAGYALNHDWNPYDRDGLQELASSLPEVEYGGLPYLYPPLTGYLFKPLALLPYFEAKYVWFVCKCAALEGIILVTLFVCRIPISVFSLGLVHLAAVYFRPVRLDFNAGNIAVFEALMVYAFFWYWRIANYRSSGVVLSFVGAIKIMPLMLILYPLHLRQYKLLIPFFISMGCIGATTLYHYNLFTSYLTFYQSTLWRQIWDEQVQSFFNCSSTTVILRTFTDTYFARPIIESDLIANTLIPLFPIAVFFLSAWLIDKALKMNPQIHSHEFNVALLIMTLLLISPRLAGYTLAWLFLPYICVAKEIVINRMVSAGILWLLSLGLLQVVAPPEHIPHGWPQLLIDKEFFALFFLYLSMAIVLVKKYKKIKEIPRHSDTLVLESIEES